MRRLIQAWLTGLALFAALAPARAQLPPSNILLINQTPVQGGSNGQCLFINSATVGAQACGGSGTVTSVSVTTANGVSGTVTNPTTTPAISLTLGAITPTSVNGNTITTGTGTLTLGSVTLNAGTGGTLGSNAFNSVAYLPLAGGTLTGALLFSADNTLDIGASGATRPRTGYYGTSLIAPLHIGGTAASSTLTLQSTSGAGTTDAIIGQTASQVERFRVTTTGLFNIGPNVAPDALLTVNANTAATVAPIGGGFHLVGADATINVMQMDGFNGQNIFAVRYATGTLASKTAPAGGATLFQMLAQSWDTAAYNTTTRMRFLTSNTQSASDHSSQIAFGTVPSGSTTIADVFFIQPSGGINVGPTVAVLASSEIGQNKVAASGSAPGAGTAKVSWVAGTNANTCKLIAYAGTSTTPVTIVDNVGAGC